MPFLGLGIKKARRMQFFHYANTDLEFRRRHIEGRGVTEFDERKEAVNAWPDYYKELYPFNGYKSIPGDAVQLACDRYFHLELHNILTKEERPPEEDSLDNPYMAGIADERGLKLTRTKKPHSAWEKLTVVLGSIAFIEMILWGLLIWVSRRGI